MRRTFLVLLLAVPAAFAADSARGGGEPARIRGVLQSATQGEVQGDHDKAAHDGDSFVFQSPEGDRFSVTVEGDNWHILSDPALAERLWELEGDWIEDDRFVAKKIFTVKEGELHKVTYYCEICNITSYRPGRCMCCQEPVELREVPADAE